MSQVTVSSSGAYTYSPSAASSSSANSLSTESASQQQSNFLTLLVAQLNNQDPMNPMDNAQMTTQIAEINTVAGIQQLNTTVQGLASQMTSSQMVQSNALVGQKVLVPGSAMTVSGTSATGTFDLPSSATAVTVTVTNSSGQTLTTIPMGALASGRQTFSVSDSSGQALNYSVSAVNGTTTVTPTTYTQDTVTSVGSVNGTLTVQTQNNGSVNASQVAAVY
ncbi:MAG: flagellar hook assembly protein FlgD [Curvibacter sp.]|nr:flagellar hook assembly protein FlgD [Curvibacter sp.]